jgi:hypothetical protein
MLGNIGEREYNKDWLGRFQHPIDFNIDTAIEILDINRQAGIA